VLDWFQAAPGRLYVVGTLLPLAAFVMLLVAGGIRSLCRPFRQQGGFAASVYWAFGGDTPVRSGALLTVAFMGASAALGVVGLVTFLNDHPTEAEHSENAGHTDTPDGAPRAARWAERIDWIRLGPLDSAPPPAWEKQREADPTRPTPPTALALELGYKIDHLTAVVFAMVTIIGTLIFVFSLGYMKDETKETVEDHEVDKQTPPRAPAADGHAQASHPHADHAPTEHELAHFHRRGRFGRFFLYLSLFCFSMLNLVIADNLFQVFISWELVGVCSFFLIGFYYERPSASRAANKAFIVNRVGDAGFLVGILIAWLYLGTLNFEEMNRRVRCPEKDSHGKLTLGDKLVRVNQDHQKGATDLYRLEPKDQPGTGSHLLLFPLAWKTPHHYHGVAYGSNSTSDAAHDREFQRIPPKPTYTDYGAIPYWLFVVMGIGIFLGCMGKSAQVPLQTWLPDAMEGPTPVSALIHAATMVAAGVYLVGRAYPLFAPEVLLTIAYIGAISLFISATIALVQTDIKRVLAYSTCSQLGFMMLALGLGGWVAGLLHLLTHAFFKALLFLCSGSVINGCHHEQDLRKMGGLKAKMPLTAWTMFIGVLAISGAPLLSGWYSKDMILSTAFGYVAVHPVHALLLILPVVTAGMTAYYMFRLWFLAFTGPPRDQILHDQAHESPPTMTVPLVVLAVFSVCVAWGWPLWDAHASQLGHILHHAEPPSVGITFIAERVKEHEVGTYAGIVALLAALIGAGIAVAVFFRKRPSTAELYAPGPAWYTFLLRKWYFDEVYDAALVEPTVELAQAAAAADKRPTDAPHGTAGGEGEPQTKQFDLLTLDGFLNAIGQAAAALGGFLRGAQTGQLRVYVAALALTAALLLGMLAVLAK
jgi:NADH-quinone oxidoreductase subunit L